MPASAAQLAEIRSQIPTEWTPASYFNDAAIHAVFDRVGTVAKTILDRARLKLALTLEKPETFSVAGEYSESGGSRVAGMRGMVAYWAARVDEEDQIANGRTELETIPTRRANPLGR